jgi:hypothetical protein
MPWNTVTMRVVSFALAGLVLTAFGNRAQAEPPASGTDIQMAPSAGAAKSDADDHQQIVGGWGFQVMDLGHVNETLAIGVRHWGSAASGWEAGVSLAVNSVAGEASFGAGGQFGYLMGLSQYKHLVVFFEPDVGLGLFSPDHGDKQIRLTVRGNLGAEVQLGMIGLAQLALTARVCAGLTASNDGKDTSFFVGTLGGQNTSARGLIEGAIGFVVYFGTEGSAL